MDTSKIKTNIIVPSDEEIIKDEKKQKRRLIWSYVWKIALLVLTIIVMVRVPYVGSYIDGLIDYIFGMSKYALYPLLIFIQISLIFHLPTEKVIKTKRFVIIISIIMLFVSCFISGMRDTITYWKTTPTFGEIMSNYHSAWKTYFLQPNYVKFANTYYVSGGILAVLISYLFNRLSYIVLIVIAAIGLSLCIFSIFNINYRSTKIGLKIRKWMIKKLGGTFNYDGFNELKDIKDNQNKFKKVPKSEIIKAAKENEVLPFELLPESDVVCFNENFKKAGNVQDKINEFFKKHNIDAAPSELNVFTTFNELCFDVKNDRAINQIVESGEELVTSAKLESYNLTIRGRTVTFEIPSAYFTKVSLRSALMLCHERPNDMTAVFALDKKSRPYMQNFKNLPSAIILGRKGSGSATLAVMMALSMCYLTKPQDLELRVLSANAEVTYNAFTKLPHTNGVIADDIGSCVKQLNEIHNILNKRLGLVKSVDANNIDEYNCTVKTHEDKLKNILVLMSNFENIIKESFQNNKVVNDILVNGPKVGIYTILQSYHVGIEAMDEYIFKACAQKYILKLDTEAESEKIFDNPRGCQLHGNGDCLTFTKSIREMIRLQVCNLNQVELSQDIDIIKIFNDIKTGVKEVEEPTVDVPIIEPKLKEETIVEQEKTEENKVSEPTSETQSEESKPDVKQQEENFMIQPQFITEETKPVEPVLEDKPTIEKPIETQPTENSIIQPQFTSPTEQECKLTEEENKNTVEPIEQPKVDVEIKQDNSKELDKPKEEAFNPFSFEPESKNEEGKDNENK